MKCSREIGIQFAKQLEIYEENKSATDYKFVCVANNYILEGCFIQHADYSDDDDPIEITIRYDNATKVND